MGKKFYTSIYLNKYIIFFFILYIPKKIYSHFENISSENLTLNASIIDITDYHSIFPIITTNNNIYIGVPPIQIENIEINVTNISSAATFDENNILLACSGEYLLSQISIDTMEENPILYYDDFNSTSTIFNDKSNYSSSISIFNSSVFIGVTQKINGTLINFAIKINLMNCTGPNYKIYIEDEPLVYQFENRLSKTNLKYPRQISCEIIKPKNPININDSLLICGYIHIYNSIYQYKAVAINTEFSNITHEIIIKEFTSLLSFKLIKVDSETIKYMIKGYSFDINLKYVDDMYKLIFVNGMNKTFSSYTDLFFYNKKYYFTSYPTDSSNPKNFYFIIHNSQFKNYFRITYNGLYVNKIIGYFDEEFDSFIYYYEYGKKIDYFFISNISTLYSYKCKSLTFKFQSGENDINIDVKSILETPEEHEPLPLYNAKLFKTTTTQIKLDESKYIYDRENETLKLLPSDNDWMEFKFYYSLTTNGLSYIFYFNGCTIKINTCLYKCSSCYNNIDTCDPDGCRENFSKFRDSSDKECYPNDQYFPNYAFNPNTNFYEKCYHTCKFCLFDSSLSSAYNHSCMICNDNLIPSYQYIGNCYQVDAKYRDSSSPKSISQVNDEKFKPSPNCNGKYKIFDTGECVTQCPKTTIYYLYSFDPTINFTLQSTEPLEKQYPLRKQSPPKYLFNDICYKKCPNNTVEDTENYTCKCSEAWEKDQETNEIICYSNNYCKSNKYFYHNDTKECVLNGCKEGYFQINFECFHGSCPPKAHVVPEKEKICEYEYNNCYISYNYKTFCSNEENYSYYGYNLKYLDTNIYFKTCSDSVYFFEKKSISYMENCIERCPESAIENTDDNTCTCKYFQMFYGINNDKYKCLDQTESCKFMNKYSILELNLCVDTLQECIDRGYKIFNDECYKECPRGSSIQGSTSTCFCINSYYNQSNQITCLVPSEYCPSAYYPYWRNNSKECFKNQYECIDRGLFIFNKGCYETCPENSEENYTDYTCHCSYNFAYNEYDINPLKCFSLNDTCEDNGYPLEHYQTQECFKLKDHCIKKGYKIFNQFCYEECPPNTEPRSSVCQCTHNFFTHDNGTIECFSPYDTCESLNFRYINENGECFTSLDDCTNKGNKIFNGQCISKCPLYSVEEDDVCKCQFNFVNDSNIMECFSMEDNCQTKGYNYIHYETNECFKTENHCIQRGLKIFNFVCYDKCPINTLDNRGKCECFFNYLNENGYLTCFEIEETCEGEGYLVNENNSNECLRNPSNCPNKKPYLIIENDTCVEKCDVTDFFKNKCKIFNDNIIKNENDTTSSVKDDMKKSISEGIENGNMDEFIIRAMNGDNVQIKNDDTLYMITTSENLKVKSSNHSSISFGECENILRSEYNIEQNKALIIFKMDYYEPGSQIPIIGYEVYHPDTKKKLDLNLCKDADIEFYIPVNIEEDDLDKYNPNSEYYNDECVSSSSENGADIILSDRKNEFNEYNLSLCETGCTFNDYEKDTKNVKCVCGVKEEQISILNISNQTGLLSYDFPESEESSKMSTLKCFSSIFSLEGLLKNIGSYIMIFISGVFLVSPIFFYKCGYRFLEEKIKESRKKRKTFKQRNNYIIPEIKIAEKKKKCKFKDVIRFIDDFNKKDRYYKPKKKCSKTKTVGVKFPKEKPSPPDNIYNSNNNSNRELNTSKNHLSNINFNDLSNFIVSYNDYEMNNLNYEEGLFFDKRGFVRHYSSLIVSKHPLIFGFVPIKDYNSFIVKFDIFFWSFGFYYFVNTFFFDENTIHEIYDNDGKFNIVKSMPKNVLSFVISHVLYIILRLLFLSERDIFRVQKVKKDKIPGIKKKLVIKYICFYCSGLLFSLFFWYYISSFGAVYQNSQIYLIENTFISFGISLIYPFLINLIPTLLRMMSLRRKKKKKLFAISKILQYL